MCSKRAQETAQTRRKVTNLTTSKGQQIMFLQKGTVSELSAPTKPSNPLLVCIKCKLLPFSLCCISTKMFLSTPFLTTEDCEGMCMQHTSLFPRASLLFSTVVLKQVLMVSGTSHCARFRLLLKEKTINPLTLLHNDRENVIFRHKRNN